MIDPLTAPLRVNHSKIVVPEQPVEFISRPLLRQRLEQATAAQVVVVIAPAGSGKTLTLADWVRSSEDTETAWISLDADDNDRGRLWATVLTSLHALPSVPRNVLAGRLPEGAGFLAEDTDLVESLAEVLDTLDAPVRVVLDDVHELTGREVLRDLGRLIRRRPDGVQFVLSSRSDPPIGIPRLRLEGRLHELRADDLRFNLEDTAALLEASGLTVNLPQAAVLHQRTEGWAAGLRLAALAMRRTDDPVAFLIQFSGDERSVAEYLAGEILDGLKPETQDFLRVVSLCSPMPSALAADLSSRVDADLLLDRLRSETALVERTSPGEYRIHPLLRSYLAADLARTRPEDHRQLQGDAARWWIAHDEPVHALRHAERAGDRELITHLVHGSGVKLLLGGDLGPLRRALAAVGPDARAADPWLALTAAITHLDARALPAAATELRNAGLAWPQAPEAGLNALRSSAELLATGLGLIGESRPFEPDDGRAAPEMEALRHASRAAAEFGNPDGADVDLASHELQQALLLARSHGLRYLEVQSLSMLATLAAMSGDYPGMVVMAQRAVAAASRHGRNPSAWTAGPLGMLAYADLMAGDPVAAAARCEEALSPWETLPPESEYTLRAVHGAALADQGRRAAGLAEIRAARTEFADAPAPPSMLAGLGVLEHRAALLNGNLDAARQVERFLAPRIGETGENLLLQAWAEAANGRHEAARSVMAPVFEPGMPNLLPSTLVEAHLIEAEAALQADDMSTGRKALERALAQAETVGVVRPFALAGACTQQLLTTRAAGNGRGPFAARVAAARAAIVPDAAALLSERELEVLTMLPSLLSAREIADEFTVSVNTVKSHIRSIYAKLGVTSRRNAVLQAHDRGLLP